MGNEVRVHADRFEGASSGAPCGGNQGDVVEHCSGCVAHGLLVAMAESPRQWKEGQVGTLLRVCSLTNGPTGAEALLPQASAPEASVVGVPGLTRSRAVR